MIFKITPEVLHDYPDIKLGIVIVHGLDNTQSSIHVKDIVQKAQENIVAGLTKETLAEHPYIAVWLETYKKFGVNPKKYIPSVKNLAERSLKGSMPSINSLVDLYNTVSLHYLLPAGGEDLDTVQGDIVLAKAGTNEPLSLMLGEKEATRPEAGEVFYKDAEGSLCRRWNWKEADRTKLTSATKNAFLILEALPPVPQEVLEQATHQLAGLIKHYCGGSVSIAFIDKNTPELIIKRNGEYVTHHPFNNAPRISAADIYAHKHLAGSKEKSVHPASEQHAPVVEGSAEHRVRLDKVEQLRTTGCPAWPDGKIVDATSQDVTSEYSDTLESRVYHVAGRLMAFREHGKTAFANIQDRHGRLQVYIRFDDIGAEKFAWVKHFIDIGDIVWFSGTSFKTKTGEITIKANDCALLSKCLYPLPEKFHGLTDIETMYRQRYLDLISNQESRNRFKARSSIVRIIRNFLDAHDFMEVETPMLQVIPGGAAAKPFVTHHNALNTDLYLRIAPELYLKRLVVGGFDRVYEINRNFRNEGISTKHNPEFTMLEFYIAYKDYHFAMDFVEQMLRTVALETNNSLQIQFGDHMLDFGKRFDRLSMRDAVKQYGALTEEDLSDTGIDAVIRKHNVKIDNTAAVWGHKLYALFEAFVEPNLVQPTFITEYPIEVSPLSKRDPNNAHIAARFELFIAGVELSNGFNELNDPFDQAERFRDQARARSAGDIEAHHYDADYVHALEYALPPTAGVGIGIDRLTMFLTNTTSIKDVILFPTLKKKD